MTTDRLSMAEVLGMLPDWYVYGSISHIQMAVRDPEWQKFRKHLKGKPTRTKIALLSLWINESTTEDRYIQVTNYINALKRGGFITP